MTNYKIKDWIETRGDIQGMETRPERFFRKAKPIIEKLGYIALSAWIICLSWFFLSFVI